MFRLYVSGSTAQSRRARENLENLCETHLAGKYEIEVIDILKKPERMAEDEILAIPTVIRSHPEPVRKIVGDLSITEVVKKALDL
jgi:circadian clock protein KaiB